MKKKDDDDRHLGWASFGGIEGTERGRKGTALFILLKISLMMKNSCSVQLNHKC